MVWLPQACRKLAPLCPSSVKAGTRRLATAPPRQPGQYPEGRFRRPKYPKHLQGYTFPKTADVTLRRGMSDLSSLLAKGGHPPFPWGLYSFTPPVLPPP
ncbi:hypothetical protein E2C01_043430 [Portunus trituberculatus]|uniref:Uncharacterized protein n=1 Tax=Portunus trituberculatus TaxID=210409 RepID=A0A5B7FQA5_PORTR|nr:hypothetical protein [Portunus trituberculatus]